MSNCLVFAWRMYWRRRAAGHRGYIVARKSHWGPFPHFLYAELGADGWRFVSYVPISPRRRLIPPPLFRGRVRFGDDQHPT